MGIVCYYGLMVDLNVSYVYFTQEQVHLVSKLLLSTFHQDMLAFLFHVLSPCRTLLHKYIHFQKYIDRNQIYGLLYNSLCKYQLLLRSANFLVPPEALRKILLHSVPHQPNNNIHAHEIFLFYITHGRYPHSKTIQFQILPLLLCQIFQNNTIQPIF